MCQHWNSWSKRREKPMRRARGHPRPWPAMWHGFTPRTTAGAEKSRGFIGRQHPMPRNNSFINIDHTHIRPRHGSEGRWFSVQWLGKGGTGAGWGGEIAGGGSRRAREATRRGAKYLNKRVLLIEPFADPSRPILEPSRSGPRLPPPRICLQVTIYSGFVVDIVAIVGCSGTCW